jgi:hypothetical protein
MRGRTFKAEILSVDRRVVVAVSTPDGTSVFSRSFHAICDAERWLARLARVGIQKSDYRYLLAKDISLLELRPLGPIQILDKRTFKRFQLPALFY